MTIDTWLSLFSINSTTPRSLPLPHDHRKKGKLMARYDESVQISLPLKSIDFIADTVINILGWSTRALNDQDRRDTVHETISTSSCHIIFLQEPKLQSVSRG
jgi:hypothetical protein